MKKIYVPKGETICLSDLHTELVIVEGTLKVSGKLTAKQLQGHGYVEAEEILCDDSSVDTVQAQIVTAKRVAATKLLVRDCRADNIVATDYLEALHVQANRLSMTASKLECCDVDEIINLPHKKRGMLGMLFAAWWRSLWTPNKLPAKAVKPQYKDAAQPVSNEPAPEVEATPSISEDFLDALIDRLEERGFVYDAPYTEPSPLPFAKEQVA